MERNGKGVKRVGRSTKGGGTKGKRVKGEGEDKGYLKRVKEVGMKFAKGGKSFGEVVKQSPFGEDVVAVKIEEKDRGERIESPGRGWWG